MESEKLKNKKNKIIKRKSTQALPQAHWSGIPKLTCVVLLTGLILTRHFYCNKGCRNTSQQHNY